MAWLHWELKPVQLFLMDVVQQFVHNEAARQLSVCAISLFALSDKGRSKSVLLGIFCLKVSIVQHSNNFSDRNRSL